MEDILDKLEDILENRKSSNSKDSYISALYKKGNNHTCVKDETKELKDKSCTSNIACHRRIGGRLVIRSVYAKTFSINKFFYY